MSESNSNDNVRIQVAFEGGQSVGANVSQEIADGYLYLMRQTYVTGQTLAIDGGGLLV